MSADKNKNIKARVINYGKHVTMAIGDSLQNVLTGMGLSGLDKTTGSSFVDINLSEREMEDAYASDWLVGKVCDLPPFDMTREWRTFDGDMDPKKLDEIVKFEKELQLSQKFKEALTWARIYGGAGIIINVDDGNEPWEPLELDNIKQGSLKHLIVADRQFLHMGEINNDPLSPNYGYPNTYRLAPTSVQIHYSRVIRFEGVPLPLQSRRRNKMWGKSLIERLYTSLVNAGDVQQNVGTLIHEATVDVIKVPDLMLMIANPDTEAELIKRFGIAKMQKSVNRMLLLDANEEYETHQQAFTGLTDMMEKFLSIVAGAADIPITRLLGQSPAGLNSTGESDIRNYYDHLAAKQNNELSPKLGYLDKIIYRNLFGSEPEPDELSFTWNSLWQMSNKEQAELESFRATRDVAYLDSGVITEDIAARDLMEKGTYSGVDAEYVKEMEEFVNQEGLEEEEEEDLEGEEGDLEEDPEAPEGDPEGNPDPDIEKDPDPEGDPEKDPDPEEEGDSKDAD